MKCYQRDSTRTNYLIWASKTKELLFFIVSSQETPLSPFIVNYLVGRLKQCWVPNCYEQTNKCPCSMAGFFSPVTLQPKNLAGCDFSCALQTTDHFLFRWPNEERKGFFQSRPYKQLSASVNSWKSKHIILKIERAAADQRMKIRTRWQTSK